MKPKDKDKLQASVHRSQLHHPDHRPSIHTNLNNQTTTHKITNLLYLISCTMTQRMNPKKKFPLISRHKGVPWVHGERPWPKGVRSVTRTKGPTNIVGKRQSRKRLNQKFWVRIKVGSIKRIDESPFCGIIIITKYYSYLWTHSSWRQGNSYFLMTKLSGYL